MGTKRAVKYSPPSTELLWGGLPWCTLYPCGTRSVQSTRGGGTHGFPIPSCMCVHACVWFFCLDYPIPPGSLSPHEGGHPQVHLALGPLGFFPLWGGTSPLPSTQTHGSNSLKLEIKKINGFV